MMGNFLWYMVAIVLYSTLLGQSKTTFIPRPVSMDQTFELASANYKFHRNISVGRKLLFDIKPFFQRSTSNQLANFFLPNCKKCIRLREDGTGDVDPIWVNLIGPDNTFYSSTVCLNPRRTTVGVVLTAYVDLCNITQGLWLGLNSALMNAFHQQNFVECDRNSFSTVPGIRTAYDAFNNPTWTAGRLVRRTLEKFGLDDIQIKLGYDAIASHCTRIAPYFIATIPTGKAPRSSYVFEPLVGSNHGSVGIGINCDIVLRRTAEQNKSITLMLDANYRYVFAASERRSFDLLRNGDWSRYLQVVPETQLLNSMPAINSFTQCVRVTPGSTFQLWTALHVQRCTWQLEAGYNFWLRAAEKVALKRNCAPAINGEAIGIWNPLSIIQPPLTTASTTNISQALVGSNIIVSDPAFVGITMNDFNLCSASNELVMSQKFYGSIGYDGWFCWFPITVSVNGSYEFAQRRGALNQCAVWAIFSGQF